MKKVWLTRTEPGASQQAEILRKQGHNVLVWPVLQIETLDPTQLRVSGKVVDAAGEASRLMAQKPTMVIALSGHAVSVCLQQQLLANVGRPKWIAVGEQTAALLTQVAGSVEVPAQATSEGLLAMPCMAQLSSDDIVWVLAGAGGREVLTQQLFREYGATVVKFELYQRVARTQPPEVSTASIGAVVIASEQGLQAFAQQWQSMSGALSVQLVVPSPRVALAATEAGFTQVHTAQGADAQAVLAALQEILKNE